MLKYKQLFLHNLELILNLTLAQIKARYRKTYAGLLWVLINPIMTFWVQAIIFKIILKLNVENYYIFLLTGILPWIFITSSLTMTSGLFINNRNSLLALKFDPQVLLSSQILDNFINYLISFVLLTVFIGTSQIYNTVSVFSFILNSILLLTFVYFLSFFISIVNVFFRDTQYILQFLLGMMYFITPIFYPRAFLDEHLSYIVDINPLFVFIELFQSSMWNGDLVRYKVVLLKASLIILGMVILVRILWRKTRNLVYLRL